MHEREKMECDGYFYAHNLKWGKHMITSSSNQQMKNIAALLKKAKERKKQGVFVVEGKKMIKEAPKEWVQKVYLAERLWKTGEMQELIEAYACEIVADTVFDAIADTKTPQGVLALVTIPTYPLESLLKKEQTHLLVLESIQDPGNLGTMLRTGEGAGVSGILMNQTTVDLFSPKTIRSTMGSIYRVPYYVTENLTDTLAALKKQQITLYAAHLKGAVAYDAPDYTRTGTAFLIGNEGNGLTEEVADCADVRIKIPMAGQVESLNAAISASLLMYEVQRQKRAKI